MKNENDIKVQIISENGDLATYAEVEYEDQNANDHPAVVEMELNTPEELTPQKVAEMNPRVDVRESKDVMQTEPSMCSKKNSRRIRFFKDASEIGLPLIHVMEGDFKGIVMLIDTGSNDNLMFGYAYHQLEEYMKPIESKCKLYGIDGTPTVSTCARGILSFCGMKYGMTFVIRENNDVIVMLSQELGFPIAGIIGTKFMAEHGWMIDFQNQEVVIPEFDISPEEFNAIP